MTTYIFRFCILSFVSVFLTACNLGDLVPSLKSEGSAPDTSAIVANNQVPPTGDYFEIEENNEDPNPNPDESEIDVLAAPEDTETWLVGDRYYHKRPIARKATYTVNFQEAPEAVLEDHEIFDPIRLAFYENGSGRFINSNKKVEDFTFSTKEPFEHNLSKFCDETEGSFLEYNGEVTYKDETAPVQIFDLEGVCKNSVDQRQVAQVPNPSLNAVAIPAEIPISCFAIQINVPGEPYCEQQEDVCTLNPDVCTPQPLNCTPQEDHCVSQADLCTEVPFGNDGRSNTVCTPQPDICTPQPDICTPQPEICVAQAPTCVPGAILCRNGRPTVETMLFSKKANGCQGADYLIQQSVMPY